MINFDKNYRMSGDTEPNEKELAALMHEVAVDAEQKSTRAKQEMQKRIKLQISEALVREGF
jgi:hypothetical protein